MKTAFPTGEHYPDQDEEAHPIALQIVSDFDPDRLTTIEQKVTVLQKSVSALEQAVNALKSLLPPEGGIPPAGGLPTKEQ